MKIERKILKGMFRPTWDKVSNPMGYVSCTCGHILQNQEAIRQHWQDGHYDTPVYEESNEN